MRLGDFDALKKDIMSYKTMSEIRKAICEVIDNAPTVDIYTIEDIQEVRENALILGAKLAQRPQGEWKQLDNQIYCNLCNRTSFSESNFCPNCGAKMKKGGAE